MRGGRQTDRSEPPYSCEGFKTVKDVREGLCGVGNRFARKFNKKNKNKYLNIKKNTYRVFF